MDYSIVDNNIVTNIVVADAPLGANWHEGNHGIGSTYDPVTDTFTPPPQPELPPVNPVPQSVSMRQARLALLGAGLLSTVDAAIAAQAEPLKSQIEIEWVYATEIDRQWPTLLALAPALGLDSDDLDNLFIAASQL